MKQTKKRASLTRQAILLFIFIAIFSCRQSTTMTKDEIARIELDVRLTLSNYYDDIRKSGLTAEFNTSTIQRISFGFLQGIQVVYLMTVLFKF